MVYDVLLHGARGVIFFGSHQLRNTIPLDEPVWDVGVRTVVRELAVIGPVLLHAERLADVTAQPASLVVRGWRLRGGRLVIAANATPFPETGVVCFGAGSTDARALFEDRSLPINQDCVRDAFGPYGVHVYRVTAPEK